MDPDAAAYIAAVETADGQALEEKVKIAIDNFVLGCKADGIWSAIKASCILAGARTRVGALTPLAGATGPDSYGFVDGDYDRKTGLVGDGSTKYLDSKRSGSSDPIDNFHMCVYATTEATGLMMYIGNGFGLTGGSQIYRSSTSLQTRNRNTTVDSVPDAGGSTGFIGTSRSDTSSMSVRVTSRNFDFIRAGNTPTSGSFHIFASEGTTQYKSNARLSFYSIGESLDLALLDARVTDLMTALGAAIP
jgi:hypothetical protein